MIDQVAGTLAEGLGEMGFTTQIRGGRFYRDRRILEIGECTSEIQRTLISRELGL